MSLEDISVSRKNGSQLGRRKFVKTVAAIAGLGLTAEALAACGDNTATSTAAAPAAPPTAASTTAPTATTAAPTTAAPTTAAVTTATATTAAASATTSGAATTAAGSGSGAPDGYSMVGATSQYKADGDPVTFTVNSTQGFVFNKGGSFIAYSNVCTHKGCKVPYVAADQKLECPCHGSQYDKSGEVVKGPAPKRLPQFDTKVVGDTLYVKVS